MESDQGLPPVAFRVSHQTLVVQREERVAFRGLIDAFQTGFAPGGHIWAFQIAGETENMTEMSLDRFLGFIL